MFTRIRRLGVISLAALFLGGVMLILTGCNGLFGPRRVKGISSRVDLKRVFQYGSQLSVQAWTAIVGVGFGLLSYGFNEAYSHLFDLCCSKRAQRNGGLDYGLYLNSQPRAPVIYGRRGLTGLITLRYLFATASIAASIGYKFGISTTELYFDGRLDGQEMKLYSPNITEPGSGGQISPCLSDRAEDLGNRAFLHDGYYDDTEPPKHITMMGLMGCWFDYTKMQRGDLYTREVVVVANKTEVEDSNGFTMPRDHNEWWRGYSDGYSWLGSNGSRVVVEWTLTQADIIMIQWADEAPWLENSDDDLAVERRIYYKMGFAVAEVARNVEDADCSELDGIEILSYDSKPAIRDEYENSLLPSAETLNWPVPMVSSWGQTPRKGVSAIVQVAMARLLSNFNTLPLRFVPAESYPFGIERDISSTHQYHEDFSYPYLDGYGTTGTGIWISAAWVFLGLGCFSVLVGSIRICVGPPILTSWMAQHIYLAQSGAITVSVSQEGLITGYEAADIKFGKLHLSKDNGRGFNRQWEQ